MKALTVLTEVVQHSWVVLRPSQITQNVSTVYPFDTITETEIALRDKCVDY